jgi:hypothetical protein
MLIAGAILLVIAAGILVVARSYRAKAHAARATETLSCGDIAQLSSGVGAEVGGGLFKQRCEVVGQAAPGDGGLLAAPHSGSEAVWHRSSVTHRYWEIEETRNDRGETSRSRVEKESTVSDLVSEAPFLVSDGSGEVLVAPDGANVDAPERVVDRFDPQTEAPSSGFLVNLFRSDPDGGTLGFRYQEWIIRPGARLYVHGVVSDATGRPSFAKDGRFIISSRSEEEIVGQAESVARWTTIAGGVLAVAGVVLLVAGALS